MNIAKEIEALDKFLGTYALIPQAYRDLAAIYDALRAKAKSAEDLAEEYIAAEIDRAPEQLRRLGEYLANALDDDRFKTAERMLLGAIEATNKAPPAAPAAVVDDEEAAYAALKDATDNWEFATKVGDIKLADEMRFQIAVAEDRLRAALSGKQGEQA